MINVLNLSSCFTSSLLIINMIPLLVFTVLTIFDLSIPSLVPNFDWMVSGIVAGSYNVSTAKSFTTFQLEVIVVLSEVDVGKYVLYLFTSASHVASASMK